MQNKPILIELIEQLSNHKSEHNLDNPTSPFWMEISKLISEMTLDDLLDSSIDIISNEKYKSGSSIIHENGFLKSSLYKDSETELQVRLHFWPAGAQDTNIHNHRWNFMSFVLNGNMTFTNYNAMPDSNSGVEKHLYEVSDANNALVKDKKILGTCYLSTHSQYKISKGSYHYCHKDVLHSGKANKASMTLMITGTPTKPSTQVIYANEERRSVERKSVSIQQQIEFMNEVREEVSCD
ncbi:TPA: hypothetical protein ACGF9M_001737 [Vibrio cholerae]